MQRQMMQGGFMTVHGITYQGPIPPPGTLAEYGNADPSFPARIMAMAEAQASHRQGIEKDLVRSGIVSARWGMAAGWTLGLVGLIATTILGLHGKEIAVGVDR